VTDTHTATFDFHSSAAEIIAEQARPMRAVRCSTCGLPTGSAYQSDAEDMPAEQCSHCVGLRPLDNNDAEELGREFYGDDDDRQEISCRGCGGMEFYLRTDYDWSVSPTHYAEDVGSEEAFVFSRSDYGPEISDEYPCCHSCDRDCRNDFEWEVGD
jgi:ribosomal protein L37E